MNKDEIKAIAKRMVNYEPSISFSVRDTNEVEDIIEDIRNNYVITFHVGTITYTFDPNKKTVQLVPNYLIPSKDYKGTINKILKSLEVHKKNLARLDSDYKKELYIHDFLVKEVEYCDEGDVSHSIVGPLLYQKAVCDGITKTAKVLFNLCKIPSKVITGTALGNVSNTKGPHAWNIVKIKDFWYNLDITFDNTISTKENIRYDYFNVKATTISYSHHPDTRCFGDFMMCISEDANYFKINSLRFKDYADALIYLDKINQERKGNAYFQIDRKYGIAEDKEKILSHLTSGSHSYSPINVQYSLNDSINVYFIKFEYRKSLLTRLFKR